MRRTLIAISIAACLSTSALAQISINFGSPGVNIGLNLGGYPTLQRIPGYPVYYAPGVNSNYFFYDGLYWVYDGNDWFESSWYNGPWYRVDPFEVPAFVLRVPVRYYRHAPSYFRSWRADEAPRWGEHWGHSWEQRRGDWNRWDRRSAPAPAPLPTYQRQYTGNRYPRDGQQASSLASQNYRYQPRDSVAQQHFQHERTQAQNWRDQQPAQRDGQRGQMRDRQQQQQQAQPQQQQQQVQPQQQAKPQQQQQAAPSNPAARGQDMRQRQQPQQQQQQAAPQPQQQQQQQRQQQPQAAPPQQNERQQQREQQRQEKQRRETDEQRG